MSHFLEFSILILSFTIVFPFVVTYIIYFFVNFFTKYEMKAFQKAVDWSTPLYILSVYNLYKMYFSGPLFSYILVFVLIVLSFLLIYQRNRDNEVILSRAVKIVWRLCFLLFSSLYVVFVLFGILQLLFL